MPPWPAATHSHRLPADYPQLLAELKSRIAAARTHAALAVNSEMIGLYWDIGHEILLRERREGWGAKVIERLAADLRREFPDVRGLSLTNLHYMRRFAAGWPDSQFLPQPAAQLPWGHIRCLLDKLEDPDTRLWYAARARENGWSRRVLQAQIASDLHGRHGNALSSFDHALPAPASELVRDVIKDPCNFEFLKLSAPHRHPALGAAAGAPRSPRACQRALERPRGPPTQSCAGRLAPT